MTEDAHETSLEIRQLVEELARPLLRLSDDDLLPWTSALEELGVDSLDAIDLIDEVTERTGVNVPTAVVFKLRSLEMLAGYVSDELAKSTNPAGVAEA